MSALRGKSLLRSAFTRATLGLAVVVLALAATVSSEVPRMPDGGQGPALSITGDGEVKPVTKQDAIWDVMFSGAFAPTLTEIVPEWSHVERGAVIARLYTPWLVDDRASKEQRLRVAEAGARQTEAETCAALADLESALLEAQEALRKGEERLAALNALPSTVEKERLAAQIEENEVRRHQAADRAAMLRQLAKEGLCGEAEAGGALHEQSKCEAEAGYLAATLARLEKQGDSFDVRRAEVKVQKLKAEMQAAEARRDLESERRRRVCDAARLAEVGQARRELQLADKRIEALTVRSPGAGYVLYGDRQEYWYHLAGQRYVPGSPIYYGEVVGSVIDPARLRIEAEIGEKELLLVTEGDRAEARLPAVPGRLYKGIVEAVLPIIHTSEQEAMETATEVQKRHGIVRVTLAEADERVRPGMKAVVSIFPRSVMTAPEAGRAEPNSTSEQESPGARTGQVAGRADLVLSGHLETKSVHYVESPLKGRVMWLAPQGALVKKGDTLTKLEPGLEEDWRAKDESEIQRLTYLQQAAELQVRLKEELVPLLQEDAKADVALAELSLQELNARPDPPDRVKAGNELAEAEWQLQGARGKLDAYRDLAGQGYASEADVKKVEMQLASADAAMAMARAKLAEVLRGASDLEKAIAEADLKVARTSLEKAKTLAEVEAAAARAELEAATARLQVYRAQADRRRRKAEQAEVKSPVAGIVIWSWPKEGQEVEAGWYLMGVADMEQAVVYGMLDESDYSKVSPGWPARVRLAGVADRLFTGRVAEIVDWPELPIWYQRSLSQGRVRPAKLFRVVVQLEDKPPTCVGMSAVVEIFRPAGAEDVRADRGENRLTEPEESHKDGKAD